MPSTLDYGAGHSIAIVFSQRRLRELARLVGGVSDPIVETRRI